MAKTSDLSDTGLSVRSISSSTSSALLSLSAGTTGRGPLGGLCNCTGAHERLKIPPRRFYLINGLVKGKIS